MSKDELKAHLANALDIEEKEIMDYRQTAPPGQFGTEAEYTVILYSFQKYVRVRPKIKATVPPAYRRAYQNPQSANKAQLLELAAILELDSPDGITKKDLVGLLEAYKAR